MVEGYSVAHSHHHDHHCHEHPLPDFRRAFFAGILLNTGFIIVEAIWGLKAHSLALLADAGHNASDVLALAMAWIAASLTKRKPSSRFTYGMRSSSIIASLANAVVLLVVVGGIGWESILRLTQPEMANSTTIMAVAALGILINGGTALLFISGRKSDLNIRAAFQHMAADMLISLCVVVSGALMLATHWLWLDPLMSLIISVLIIFSTWELLEESMVLALQAVPRHVDPEAVKEFLKRLPGVREVHDLHIWAMSTTDIASSVHLVMAGGHPGDAFIRNIAHEMEHDFNISHTTIQIEVGDMSDECPLAPDHII
ncbi:MAG: cation transporter [Proteobacteria bacterium]|nr:cation transporter [Pseudomonadota bacterium]